MRRQLRALGLGHDPRRSVATTDPGYYRWTQWIFLQLFDSWYDEDADRARPIAELIPVLEADPESNWANSSPVERRALVDSYRLAYLDEAPVNWCPALGTVLANEEVTPDGRSERGNHPVYRRPLKQWMLRITAYAERLLADLDLLDWTDSIKRMQRNWIGRSEGAEVDFAVEGHEDAVITVFTTRPDTLFGATYMVLAPEHPLRRRDHPGRVARRVARRGHQRHPGLVARDLRRGGRPGGGGPSLPRVHRDRRASSSARRRARRRPASSPARSRSNPVNDRPIPIFVADYVLMGYGTGAIMAVPGARPARLRVRAGVRPADRRYPAAGDWLTARHRPTHWPEWPEAFIGDGSRQLANDAASLDGLDVAEAKQAIIRWLEEQEARCRHGHLQAARLAVQPAALLGRAVPDRLRRARPSARGARVHAPGRAARDHRLRAGDRRRRRRERARSAAGARRALGDRGPGPPAAGLGRDGPAGPRRARRRTAAS